MKNLNQLLNSNLTKSIEIHDNLSEFVYNFMHLDKKKHKLWIVTKQQHLTIMTDNPYLGTQLRYQQDAICLALNKHFLLQLKNTKVKIIPPSVTKEKTKKDLFPIGEKASTALRYIANSMDDSELKNSLLRLTKKNQ